MYAPVVGIGVVPASLTGEFAGLITACGTASLERMVSSAATKLITTEFVLASTTTPLSNLHVAGVFKQISAPTIPL